MTLQSQPNCHLILNRFPVTIQLVIIGWGDIVMSNTYGSDFITITDDDGNEYELEVLNTLEYNGCSYLAVIPADAFDADSANLQVFIIKSVEENGESILYTVDDDAELSAVNDLLMESIFSDQLED